VIAALPRVGRRASPAEAASRTGPAALALEGADPGKADAQGAASK
jgi:hypothetical protein